MPEHPHWLAEEGAPGSSEAEHHRMREWVVITATALPAF